MNILKLPEIKNLLGIKTYKQALACYEKGDVRNLKIEGTNTEASVLGSALANYRVRINFKGATPDMECDCAYPYLCKHIGAVLIKITNENFILEELSPFKAVEQKALWIKEKKDEELVLTKSVPAEAPAPPDTDEVAEKKTASPTRDSLQSHLREISISLEQLSQLPVLPVSQPTAALPTPAPVATLIAAQDAPPETTEDIPGQGHPLVPGTRPTNKALVKLIFLVRNESTNLGLKPALVYIKANGQPGRVERFVASRLTEPLTNDEARLLRWLAANCLAEQKRVVDCLPFFINKAIPALYLENAGRSLTVAPINSLTMRFRVHSLDWHKTVYFKPLLFFNLPGAESGTATPSTLAGGVEYNNIFFQSTSQDSLYLDQEHASLYYRQADPDFVAFFSSFTENEPLFTYQDIELLHKIAQAYAVPVYIDFPFDKVRLKAILPTPLLRITESSRAANREAVLTLTFRYLDTEVPYESEPPFIINLDDYHALADAMAAHRLPAESANSPNSANSANPAILVLERQGEYEGLVYRAIKELIHKELKQRYYVWSNRFIPPAHLPLVINADTFLHTYGEELLANGIELQLGQKQVKLVTKLLLDIKTDTDWFDIKLYMQDTEDQIFPFREGSKFFSLPEFTAGGLAPAPGDGEHPSLPGTGPSSATGLLEAGGNYLLINQQELARLRHLYEAGKDKHESLKISRYNFQLISGLYDQIINREDPEIKKCREIMDKLKNFQAITRHEQPANFDGTLRPYQQAGYNWLLFLHEYQLNGCLADDMGLGKTIQTLALLQQLKDAGQLGVSVLVLPVVTISNWEREIQRFTPRLTFVRHAGKERARESAGLAGYDLVLVSYHTLRNDLAFFKELDIDYLILDEAQNIKNASSQIFKAIRSLKSRHRLSLTGTPLENNIMELWSQLDFLNPGLLGTRVDFKDRYLAPAQKPPAAGDAKPAPDLFNGTQAGAQAKLKKLVFPFILRRKKEDVLLELPPKEEIVLYVEMGEKQQRLYDQLKDSCRKEVLRTTAVSNPSKAAFTLFSMLLRLRQMVLFPQMVDKRFAEVESAKFEALQSLLAEVTAEGHKVLVFSQFIEPLHMIQTYCEAAGIPSVTLTGQTRNREQVIHDFQENPEIKVFLLSLKAGGVGINLTAAGYVILFDPWWNPAVEAQALDRAHRMGQVQKVLAYKLIVKDSIEEKILKLQARKKQLVSELITDDKNFFKSLSREDILELFN